MIAARSRRSAVMIVNPSAGRLGDETRSAVIKALGESFSLDVVTTTGPGSGITAAAEASAAGTPLVIAFGGDGNVNEVTNGVAGTSSALGIVPGGTMNVFARALGIPTDPLEAVEHLVSAAVREPQVVHLGRMDDRYFTFSAGCGFDAEAAQLVESHLTNKRRFGEPYFYWSAFRVLLGSYRHRNPTMTLSGPFGDVEVSMAIACNAGPYAYLLNRPVRLAPEVHLEKGLDVFALRKMRIEALPFYTLRALTGDISKHRDAFYATDIEAMTVSSDKPFARHVDGEPLEPSTSVELTLVRDALKVFA